MKWVIGVVSSIAIAFLTVALMFAPTWDGRNITGLIGLRGFVLCLGVLGEIGAAYLVTQWEKLQ